MPTCSLALSSLGIRDLRGSRAKKFRQALGHRITDNNQRKWGNASPIERDNRLLATGIVGPVWANLSFPQERPEIWAFKTSDVQNFK